MSRTLIAPFVAVVLVLPIVHAQQTDSSAAQSAKAPLTTMTGCISSKPEPSGHYQRCAPVARRRGK